MNRRVLYGRLGGQAKLNAYIRSLGPAGWWRMDQGVTVTGAGISQVDDLSGNARHLLDPGTTRPIYLPYSGTKYLYLPGVAGNYASTPDSAANSITGDIDIRVRVALDDWTPAANDCLISKDQTSKRCYRFDVDTAGKLTFFYTSDGATTTGRIATSSVATGIADGEIKWCRSTYNSSTGKVNFYLSDDGVSWSLLGAEQTITAGAIFDGDNVVEVGTSAGGAGTPLNGKIYRAIIKNGIDGTTVVDFNPADADGDGDTSFASSTTGETWTINSSGGLPAQIVGRASALFNGTSHYLKCSAFTLNQPETVYIVFKQVSWTEFDTVFDGNSLTSGRYYQAAASARFAIHAGNSVVEPATVLSVGTYGVACAVFNVASSLLQINNNTPVTGSVGSGNMGGFTLGVRGDGTIAFSNIQVSEAIIFPAAHDAAKRARIVAGLMARHGVA